MAVMVEPIAVEAEVEQVPWERQVLAELLGLAVTELRHLFLVAA
jgi:hypothetical protein